MHEVYVTDSKGWFSDKSTFVTANFTNSTYPFLLRGGNYNDGENAGIFSTWSSNLAATPRS